MHFLFFFSCSFFYETRDSGMCNPASLSFLLKSNNQTRESLEGEGCDLLASEFKSGSQLLNQRECYLLHLDIHIQQASVVSLTESDIQICDLLEGVICL